MAFKEYFAKRVLNSFVIWIFVLILNFFLFYTPSAEMRLDNFLAQVGEYLNFVFLERFGPYSRGGEISTFDYVVSSSVFSVILLGLSLTIAITSGIFLGTLASYKQGKKIDAVLTVVVLTFSTFPVWWVALVLRTYLYPHYFPAFFWHSSRWMGVSPWTDIFAFIPDFLNHLILPLVTFVSTLTGIYFIVTRSSLRSVYTEESYWR